jgi:hypothetical protein
MPKYIIRLDDMSAYSNFPMWKDILEFASEHGVRCLIAVIPKCEDKKLMAGDRVDDNSFWFLVKHYSRKHDIAMHGLNHEIFGGKSFDKQFKLMSESMKIFIHRKIIPDCFVAPKHIYDDNTLRSLKALGISYMSDGVGLYPWKHLDSEVIMVPQVLWRPRTVPFGVVTFCLHPDTMSIGQITELKKFILENRRSIISVFDVDLSPLEYINFIFEPIYLYLFRRKFKRAKR